MTEEAVTEKVMLQPGFQIIEADTAREMVDFFSEVMVSQPGSLTSAGFSVCPRPPRGNDPEGVPTFRYAIAVIFAPGTPTSGIVVPRTEAKVKFHSH